MTAWCQLTVLDVDVDAVDDGGHESGGQCDAGGRLGGGRGGVAVALDDDRAAAVPRDSVHTGRQRSRRHRRRVDASPPLVRHQLLRRVAGRSRPHRGLAGHAVRRAVRSLRPLDVRLGVLLLLDLVRRHLLYGVDPPPLRHLRRPLPRRHRAADVPRPDDATPGAGGRRRRLDVQFGHLVRPRLRRVVRRRRRRRAAHATVRGRSDVRLVRQPRLCRHLVDDVLLPAAGRHARPLRQDLPRRATSGCRNPRAGAIAAGRSSGTDWALAAALEARRQRHEGCQDARHVDGSLLRVVATVLRPLRCHAVLRVGVPGPSRGGGGRDVARLLQQFHQPVRLRVPQPRLSLRVRTSPLLRRRRMQPRNAGSGAGDDDARKSSAFGDVSG